MMLLTPKTRAEFDLLVPDEPTAVAIFTEVRWPDGPCCDRCGSKNLCKLKRDNLYQCRVCRFQTSIRSGCAMRNSKKPIRDWLFAMWRCAYQGGDSIRSIARELRMRYATVFRMVHKIRVTLAARGAWLLTRAVSMAVAEVPAPKPAKGDPPDRPPVVVPVAAAADRTAKDLVRFGIARLDQPDAEALEDLRYHDIAPDAELTVIPGRVRYPTNRLTLELDTTLKHLLRWLWSRFTGVSRKYMANYLAHNAYVEERRHDPGLFGRIVRRVATEPWRRELALATP